MEKHRPSAADQLHKPKPQFTKQETGVWNPNPALDQKVNRKRLQLLGAQPTTLFISLLLLDSTPGTEKNSHKIEQKSAYIRSALQGLKLCYQDTKA